MLGPVIGGWGVVAPLVQSTATSGGAEEQIPAGLFPTWIPPWVIDAVSALLVLVIAWGLSQLLVRLFGRRIAQRSGVRRLSGHGSGIESRSGPRSGH